MFTQPVRMFLLLLWAWGGQHQCTCYAQIFVRRHCRTDTHALLVNYHWFGGTLGMGGGVHDQRDRAIHRRAEFALITCIHAPRRLENIAVMQAHTASTQEHWENRVVVCAIFLCTRTRFWSRDWIGWFVGCDLDNKCFFSFAARWRRTAEDRSAKEAPAMFWAAH